MLGLRILGLLGWSLFRFEGDLDRVLLFAIDLLFFWVWDAFESSLHGNL